MKEYFANGINYRLDGSGCKVERGEGTFGYRHPADPEKNIYLCDLYLLAAIYPTDAIKYDTKSGVILHELSHKAVGTNDHIYTYEACNGHAMFGHDNVTTEAADCIQIFAEYAYLVGERENVHEDL